MSFLRHIVIFIYIAELVSLAMLFARHHRLETRLSEQPVPMLCAAVFVRILVRLVYFYVEYFIIPWRLSILFNAVMDTTYVVSVGLSLLVVCKCAGVAFPHARLFKAAAVIYVLGLAIVSIIWVDPGSNSVINMVEGVPQAIAVTLELAFLAVVFIAAVRISRSGDLSTVLRALLVVACLYALFIAFWDVSLFVHVLEPIHNIKPFDGVLVFGAANIAVMVSLIPDQRKPEEEAPSVAETDNADFDAFASEHKLTARETEVLALLYQGLTASEVAERLVVSINTARRHIYNIYRKAGVSNRYELIYQVGHPNDPVAPSTSENRNE